MQKLMDSLKDKEGLIYGLLGVSFLAGYIAFGRKMVEQHFHVNLRQSKNMLDANF